MISKELCEAAEAAFQKWRKDTAQAGVPEVAQRYWFVAGYMAAVASAVKPGVYRHYKGGLYTVLFIERDSDNDKNREERVCYVSLTTGRVNTRTLAEFNNTTCLDCVLCARKGCRECGAKGWHTVKRFEYVAEGLDTLKQGPASALQNEVVRLRDLLKQAGINPDEVL